MIRAEFFRRQGFYTAFEIRGHAGYADWGQDIVCAAVTSAVMTILNGITECAGMRADVTVSENEIRLSLAQSNQTTEVLLAALKLQLEVISEQYSGTIQMKVTEV